VMKDTGLRIQTENGNNAVAIKVENVSKTFRLPHNRQNSLKSSLINVVKRGERTYEKQKVLKDVSFEIKKGEFFGIAGRNGSGKSTLLKMLAGIYKPTKGKITVNGSLTPFIELGVGFNPELTGRENVYLNGALLGFDNKDVDVMYDDIVEFAELGRFMDQKLKNYSSGMQVRLAFSIAIRAQSDILLLDEVLAVGDAAFQKKCFEYFRTLKREKRTIVFISHDMNAIREYCDRAALIDEGELKFIGDSEKIAQEYTKLFMRKEAIEKKSNTANRWGSGAATIVSCDVEKVSDENVSIRVEAVFHEATEEPIFGFSIKNPIGIKIIENNSKWERLKIGKVRAGETISVTWNMPNIFTNGDNFVNVAVCDQDAADFFDSWDEATIVTIDKDEVTTGVTLPNDTIEIHRR